MLGLLLSFVNPLKAIANEIIRWKMVQQNAATEAKRIEAEENIRILESRRDVVLAEQNNFLTRMVRPLWALPFIIYTWKIIVWDKVLGLGTTDPLDERMWWLMMTIAGAYFFFRGTEKIVRLFK